MMGRLPCATGLIVPCDSDPTAAAAYASLTSELLLMVPGGLIENGDSCTLPYCWHSTYCWLVVGQRHSGARPVGYGNPKRKRGS